MKKKKFKFGVKLTVKELVSVPFVNGRLFAKARLIDGGDFVDTSQRAEVKNHRVCWGEDFQFTCKMYAKAHTGVLEACTLRISVRKEARGGRIEKLGYVDINLAEFAGTGSTPYRYLLQGYESNKGQDNSILQVSLLVSLQEGDMVFKRPMLNLPASDRPAVVSTEDSLTYAGSGSSRFSGEGLSLSATSAHLSAHLSTDGEEAGGRTHLQVPIDANTGSSVSLPLPPIADDKCDSGEQSVGFVSPRHLVVKSQRLSAISISSQDDGKPQSAPSSVSRRPRHSRRISWDAVMQDSVKLKTPSIHVEGQSSAGSAESVDVQDSCSVGHQVSSKTSRTRQDANDIIEQLLSGSELTDLKEHESQGLQLFVGHDGTARVAGKDLSRNAGGFVQVVMPTGKAVA